MSDTIYRAYDQQGLDRQYRVTEQVPDFADYFAELDASSDRAAEALDCELDVAYGDGPGEKLDIFLVRGQGAPIHVFIHGGYWRAFDKSGHRFVARPLVGAGVAAILPNYDLCPKVTMDDIVRQNRAAIAWTYKNAERFGGDRDRLYVSGHSAGGHLTGMMMSTDWTRYGLPPDAIKGGVAISGLHDLEPIRLCFLNEDVRLDPDMAHRNSPIHNIPKSAPPQIITVGGKESDEFRRQSRDYCDAWTAAGLDGVYLEAPGLHHVAAGASLEKADSVIMAAILTPMGAG